MLNEGVVLDAVLVAIVVLSGLLAYWRGAVRTLIELAGILLGGELALWWSDNLADRIVELADVSDDRARFVAALGLLIAGTVGIGAIGANLLATHPSGRPSQLLGFLLGLGNGLIFLALVLRYYALNLSIDAERILDESSVARFMWEDYDLLLLGVVLTDFGLLVIWWILGPITSSNSVTDPPAPQRVPASAGAVETHETPRNPYSQPVPSETSASAPTNDLWTDVPVPEEALNWESSTERADRPIGPTFPDDFEDLVARTASTTRYPKSDGDVNRSAIWTGICRICGESVSDQDQFCPECGASVVGPVED